MSFQLSGDGMFPPSKAITGPGILWEYSSGRKQNKVEDEVINTVVIKPDMLTIQDLENMNKVEDKDIKQAELFIPTIFKKVEEYRRKLLEGQQIDPRTLLSEAEKTYLITLGIADTGNIKEILTKLVKSGKLSPEKLASLTAVTEETKTETTGPRTTGPHIAGGISREAIAKIYVEIMQKFDDPDEKEGEILKEKLIHMSGNEPMLGAALDVADELLKGAKQRTNQAEQDKLNVIKNYVLMMYSRLASRPSVDTTGPPPKPVRDAPRTPAEGPEVKKN